MNKKGQMGIGMLVIMFVGIIVAIALFTPIMNTIGLMTNKQVVENEAVDISSARIAGGDINSSVDFTVTNAPEGWKITDCPLGSVVYGNSTDDYTLTTDYTIVLSTGVLNVENTTTTVNGGNATLVDYSYCADGYNKDSSSRSIISLVLIFAALAIFAFVLEKAEIFAITEYLSFR